MEIEKIVAKQRVFFRTGKTIPLSYRKIALRRLARSIKDHEEDIYTALKADLNKSKTEAFMCEIGMTLAELSYMLKHMSCWAQKEYKVTPLAQFSATSFTIKEPYGVVLVMSPWNYPFMLTMEPLIGAIAAGNCCVVKPSAYAPATSAVIRTILRECFDEEYVAVVEGGRAENQALLDQRFDYIFFTGGVSVGKLVIHIVPNDENGLAQHRFLHRRQGCLIQHRAGGVVGRIQQNRLGSGGNGRRQRISIDLEAGFGDIQRHHFRACDVAQGLIKAEAGGRHDDLFSQVQNAQKGSKQSLTGAYGHQHLPSGHRIAPGSFVVGNSLPQLQRTLVGGIVGLIVPQRRHSCHLNNFRGIEIRLSDG